MRAKEEGENEREAKNKVLRRLECPSTVIRRVMAYKVNDERDFLGFYSFIRRGRFN